MPAPSLSLTPRRIPAHFPSKRHLLSCTRAEGASLSVMVSSSEWYSEGTAVRIELSLGDCPARFVLEGTVAFVPQAAWQRNGHQLAVRFQGEEKRKAAEMVASCAGRPASMGTAQRPRFPTSIRCRVRAGAKRLAAEVRDISITGAFVAIPAITGLRVGDNVQLVLSPGLLGLGGTPLEVRVMWVGEKAGVRGFGVRFLGDQVRIAPAVRKHLPTAA